MSLPPGFLDELRGRTSLAQVVGRKVSWDRRKTNSAKGDWWAPCPFHQEKSASFHVDDRKGYYYCFGCHAKGDAIGFVKETENVGFMEAVEILAREAGMQMPAQDPKAKIRADRASVLAEVMEQAVQWTRLQLKTGQAAEARAYLARRGLDPQAVERWEIGFVPREGLFRHLTAKGIPAQDVLDAGIAAPSQRGGEPYDRFRNRILFPIRDGRGRAIAFGGRAMDPADRAKYLNSPETLLFDKGRNLYNVKDARAAAGPDRPLIVAEGYMDVIALSEAGFRAAVAPLGTAVTEAQLQLMWRIHPEPVIALDGDAAGLRAATRVMDLALPMLQAGQSLRFAIMPPGKDPDDVIREGGAAAMHAVLDAALPMVRLLWRRETEGRSFDSPERKAALDRALSEATAKIADQTLRRHYEDDLRQMKWEVFRAARSRPRDRAGARTDAPVRGETRRSALAQADAARAAERLREEVILAGLLTHPGLLPRFEFNLERAEFRDPDYERLRDALLRHAGTERPLEAVRQEIPASVLDRVFASPHVAIAPAVRARDDAALAAVCLGEDFAKLDALHGARRELDEALADFDDGADEGLTWRLAQAAEALGRASRAMGETGGVGDFETAPNGARINREERRTLDSLLDRIDIHKGRRKGEGTGKTRS